MASLQDVLSALQNGVTAINNLAAQIATTFPSITTTSTAAPVAGATTFTSSQAALFGTITTSSGGSYRIPLYASS